MSYVDAKKDQTVWFSPATSTPPNIRTCQHAMTTRESTSRTESLCPIGVRVGSLEALSDQVELLSVF